MTTPDDQWEHGGARSESAARLMDLLGLTDDELCTVLEADPLSLLSGQLQHRPELPILFVTGFADRTAMARATRDLRYWSARRANAQLTDMAPSTRPPVNALYPIAPCT